MQTGFFFLNDHTHMIHIGVDLIAEWPLENIGARIPFEYPIMCKGSAK